MRLRAIFCCLYFGVMPWQLYETAKHYEGWSYLRHLRLNINQALIWLTFRETDNDCKFEQEVNTNWRFVFAKLLRWQAGAKAK